MTQLLAIVVTLVLGFLLTTKLIPFVFIRLGRMLGFRMRLTPITAKRIQRFKAIKRGYYSFLIITTLFTTSFFLELLVNDKPLYVRFEDQVAYPAIRDWGNAMLPGKPFASFDPATDYGFTSPGPLDYELFQSAIDNPDAQIAQLLAKKRSDREKFVLEVKDLKAEIAEAIEYGDEPEEWLVEEVEGADEQLAKMDNDLGTLEKAQQVFAGGEAVIAWPIYPFGPDKTRMDLINRSDSQPLKPSFRGVKTNAEDEQLFGTFDFIAGTDSIGVDVLPQLLYGFRVSLAFAILVGFIGYAVGVVVGGIMGYFGGWVDILLQRFIEIWSSIPFLYTMMIVASIMNPTFILLVVLLIILRSWMAITYLIRGEYYREKAKDYVQAAIGTGVSDTKVMLRHILPNSMVPVISRLPFSFVNYINSLVALDFLGFGLPPAVASWGRLLRQGFDYVTTFPHLVILPVLAIAATLFMVVMIGEAVREAFDPKVYSRLR